MTNQFSPIKIVMYHHNQELDKEILCPIIFNLAYKPIIRKVKEFEAINLLGRKLQIIAYSDDIAEKKKMNEIIDVIYRVAAIIGFKCNTNKCKSLIFFIG